MMRRLVFGLILSLLLFLAYADDASDLADKLKHLEEDVALVKELMKLRGSSGAPSSPPASTPSPSQQEQKSNDASYSSASTTPSKSPTQPAATTTTTTTTTTATATATATATSSSGSSSSSSSSTASAPTAPGDEPYPPGNARYGDVKSTVTFDAPSDRSRLVITSFKFNPQGEVSAFVDKIFGARGMYYDDKLAKELGVEDISDAEIAAAQQRFKDAFSLKPEDAMLSPACSVDMLGMWHPRLAPTVIGEDPAFKKSPGIAYKNDMLENLKGSSALGEASVHMSSLMTDGDGTKFGKEEWKCYYRDMWKLDNRAAAVFFYCPSPSRQHCEHLELMATHKPDPNDFGWGRVKVDVAMKSLEVRGAARVVWRMSLEAKISWRGRMAERESTKDFKRRAGMAVCTVIPYSTFDKEKTRLNGVMLFEWLRYYLRMGYKVHIYDRDGANAKHIFTDQGRTYHGGASTGNFEWNNLIYHNYTMLSVIDASSRGVMYDNTEDYKGSAAKDESFAKAGVANALGAEERKWLTDRDKSLTFTQCRMEVDALWGIGDVFTGDFDEFVLCPDAPLTPMGQYDFVRSKLNEEKDKGITAMQIFQRVPACTSMPDMYPRECILKKLENGDASILECYAPFKAIVAAHTFKSFMLGHGCPVQNYHQAYNINHGFRQYECGDKNYLSLDTKTCALMHLTTHPKDFEKPCCGADKYTKEQKDEYRKKENSELWQIVHHEG